MLTSPCGRSPIVLHACFACNANCTRTMKLHSTSLPFERDPDLHQPIHHRRKRRRGLDQPGAASRVRKAERTGGRPNTRDNRPRKVRLTSMPNLTRRPTTSSRAALIRFFRARKKPAERGRPTCARADGLAVLGYSLRRAMKARRTTWLSCRHRKK